MDSSSSHIRPSLARYEFGPFRLDLDRSRILQDGRAVSWRSKRHFELLRVLIDAEPEVVIYDELRHRVWGGKDVQPQTIAQTVMNLRERLGVYADCIRNQPGKGYYFDRPPLGSGPHDSPSLEILTLLKVANEEWTRRTGPSLLRALELFQRVISLEPTCVDAYLGIAACVTMGCHAGFGVVPKTRLGEARQSAEKAIALAKERRHKAAALCQIAQIRMMYDWDLNEAEHLLQTALSLDAIYAPLHQFLSHLYLVTGRWHAVMDAITAARRIEPSSPTLHSTSGLLLHLMRRHREAIEVCESAVSLHPEFGRGYVILGFAYDADGQYDRAVAAFHTAFEMEEQATPLAGMGHAYAAAGKHGQARAVLERLRRLAKTQFVSQYFFALVHAGLGDARNAISCLERAYAERCDWLIHAGVEPRWDGLRQYARFQRLIKRIGLPVSQS